MNLHEECLLKYLLNPLDLLQSTELLKFNNSLIEKSICVDKILAKKAKINFNELGDILGKLGEITSKLKLPILSTIIVNSGDELPAPGYFRMAALHSVYTRHDKQLDIKKNSQLENLTRKKRI